MASIRYTGTEKQIKELERYLSLYATKKGLNVDITIDEAPKMPEVQQKEKPQRKRK